MIGHDPMQEMRRASRRPDASSDYFGALCIGGLGADGDSTTASGKNLKYANNRQHRNRSGIGTPASSQPSF